MSVRPGSVGSNGCCCGLCSFVCMLRRLCCRPPDQTWKRMQAARNPEALLRDVAAAIAAPDTKTTRVVDLASLPTPPASSSTGDSDEIDMEALDGLGYGKIEAALQQHGFSMDDLGELAGMADALGLVPPEPPAPAGLHEMDPTWEPNEPNESAPVFPGGMPGSAAELPDVPVGEFVIIDNTLVMSDNSAIGTACARNGTLEIYSLRMDRNPHMNDPWWRRHVVGIRRAYLLNQHKVVVGACYLNFLGTEIIPERPLLPVARTQSGPAHPLSLGVRRAMHFLFAD